MRLEQCDFTQRSTVFLLLAPPVAHVSSFKDEQADWQIVVCPAWTRPRPVKRGYMRLRIAIVFVGRLFGGFVL